MNEGGEEGRTVEGRSCKHTNTSTSHGTIPEKAAESLRRDHGRAKDLSRLHDDRWVDDHPVAQTVAVEVEAWVLPKTDEVDARMAEHGCLEEVNEVDENRRAEDCVAHLV